MTNPIPLGELRAAVDKAEILTLVGLGLAILDAEVQEPRRQPMYNAGLFSKWNHCVETGPPPEDADGAIVLWVKK